MTACDVVVIGGGMAALCAALAARQAGASVLLREAAPRALRGGNTRHSRNFRVVHTTPTLLSPGTYTESEFRTDLEGASSGLCDPALAEVLVRGSESLPEWLAHQGVLFQPVSGGALPYSRKTVFFLGGGTAAVNALYARAETSGIRVQYDDPVAPPAFGTTRAVVLACGGFQANHSWLRQGWGAAAEHFLVRGTPHARGEALRWLLDQGAAPAGEEGAAHLVAIDGRAPREDGGIVTRIQGIPEGIVVDIQGRRCYDEAADQASSRYARWGQRVARLPGQLAWLILDHRARNRVDPSIYPGLEAETLPALALALGVDAAPLVQTVTRFNAAVLAGSNGATAGLDPPKSRNACPLLIPPFSAWPIRPGITFTGYGIRTDGQARVKTAEGILAENLFAAGMIMAPALLGRGYISGTALTIGAVFGRIAGEEAARYALD